MKDPYAIHRSDMRPAAQSEVSPQATATAAIVVGTVALVVGALSLAGTVGGVWFLASKLTGK